MDKPVDKPMDEPMDNEKSLAKDSVVDLDIIDLGVNGEGIGKIEKLVVFVKNAVPGDKVRVRLFELKKNYAFGAVVKFIEHSDIRQEPSCKSFGYCGGCSLQHIEYPSQLSYKLKKVNDSLARIGKVDLHIDEIKGMTNPTPYRNKATYHVQSANGRSVIGFYGEKSNRVVPVSGCKICPDVNESIIDAVLTYMNECGITPYDQRTRKGTVKSVIVRQSYTNGEILVCLVAAAQSLRNTAGLFYHLNEAVPGHSINGKPAILKGISLNVSMGRKHDALGDETKFIWGDQFINERIGEIDYRISPISFFQINTAMAEILYDTVKEFCALTGNELVIDAYCGTGSITLYLARQAKEIIGVELSPSAIADAKTNAELNKIENASFIQGDSAKELKKLYDADIEPDIIVLDPPRSGCSEEVLVMLRKLRPKRIVYVSCDPATLARDLAVLETFGFHADKGRCFDMFCWSGHVETVCLIV